MLVIRLQRAGRKHLPFYRIVVTEKTSPVKGRYVERVGSYNPLSNPKQIEIDAERFMHYVGNGAHPSPTVARLAKGQGIEGMEKFIPGRVMKPSKAEVEAEEKRKAEEAAKAEAAAQAAAEKEKAEAEAKAAAETAATEEASVEATEETEAKEEKKDDAGAEKA